MKRTAIIAVVGFAVGMLSSQRFVVQATVAAVVAFVLACSAEVARRRRRRRAEAEQVQREAHLRALHQLAADARRRPDYPTKLPRI